MSGMQARSFDLSDGFLLFICSTKGVMIFDTERFLPDMIWMLR